jgi:hypothetical protein
MTPLVAVWIDHEKAVLAFARDEQVETKTVHSGIEPHPHWAGNQEGGGEKKYEARYAQRLDHFYDGILSHFHDARALYLFGPGEAKLELERRLKRVKRLAQLPLTVETSDRLTDAQIVAKAREQATALARG